MLNGVGILSQSTISLKWLRICDFYQSSGDKGLKGFDGPVGLKGQSGEKNSNRHPLFRSCLCVNLILNILDSN